MSWKVKKYRELIVNRYGEATMSDLEKHVYTLRWNQDKVSLHKEAIEQCWNDVFGLPKVSFGGKKFKHAYYYSMAEGEAIIHSLHSQADILACLINVILGSRKLTGKFYFWTVKKKLEEFGIASEVTNNMQFLLDAQEFKYVNAFCNTIKHNCLINASWKPGNLLEPNSYEKIKSGMKFSAFTYRNSFTSRDESYPAVHIRDIYGSYRSVIDDKICAIGNRLNDFLSQV